MTKTSNFFIAIFTNLFHFSPNSDEENDEELDQLMYLPVAPEIDDPEEPQWTTTEVCTETYSTHSL